MNEQELGALLDIAGRHNVNTNEAFRILEEIVHHRLWENPDALAVLANLRRLIEMMENVYRASQGQKPS